MRFSITTVLFAASLASAYTIANRQTTLPACAQTCYANTSPAPCNATDVACQCVNENFGAELTKCVMSNCTQSDQLQAQQAVIETCKTAGVDISGGDPFPACAQTCVQNTKSSTCADPNDDACFCKDTAWVQAVDTCFKSSCTDPDLQTAKDVGEAECRAYGVDISPTVGA
ncbi:hypothetical protein M407DRAFT_103825 [Tulasnella calospora MUT 4182]|uniref:CFEM domain-containing protein n=1 Tax=Tulasnella calospora MUT 4182 TaxID=1051891 RepID=A0A0C3QE74_9AGAM|nr:hypothetical protein M407DRAFT_103825 [Tulasnella calospora MUT 4182]